MDAKKIIFSIIIPTYNRAEMLVVAVRSVLRQTCPNWELIIIDDASTDNTQDALQWCSRDSRVRIITNKENQERSRSRNKGIDAAKGDYICFLDSDDFFEENHLAGILRKIEQKGYPVAFFHTHVVKIDQQQRRQEKIAIEVSATNQVESVIAHPIPIITVAIHRNCFLNNRFEPSMIINEDIYLLARIAAVYPIITVNVYSVNWMIHGANTVDNVKDHFTPQLDAADRMFNDELLKSHLSKKFQQQHRHNLYNLLVYHYRSNFKKAVKYAVEAWKCVPGFSYNRNNWIIILYHFPGGSVLRSLRARFRKQTLSV